MPVEYECRFNECEYRFKELDIGGEREALGKTTLFIAADGLYSSSKISKIFELLHCNGPNYAIPNLPTPSPFLPILRI